MSASSVTSNYPRGLTAPPEIMTQPERCLVLEPGRTVTVKVQAVGSGLQYQWCKKREDDTTSPVTAQQVVFRENLPLFKRTVDAASLYPLLYNRHLLTPEQMEELTQDVVGNTNTKKVDKLSQWLQNCGNFLEILISCLRETDHHGHIELASSLENDFWVPLSAHHLHYDGVRHSTLTLCHVKDAHQGEYRCRVTNDKGGSVLSDTANVSLVKPDRIAIEAFVSDLEASPDKGAQLAQNLISKIQPGSMVGYVALTEAVKRCGDCKEVVRAFLANGWSPDGRLEDGRPLVHVLAELGCNDSLRLLLRGGNESCIRLTDEDRCTPLHVAVRAERVETLKVLLEMDSTHTVIDYQDKEFSTVLHRAVELGSVEMVQAILSVPNITLGVQNKDHQTAMQLAKLKDHHSIISMLEEKEAQQTYSSPSAINGAAKYGESRRSNSCEFHRTQSELSQTSSGYDSRSSMQRAESMLSMPVLTAVSTLERQVLELQRQLLNYKGTLTGKVLLRRGVLKKCNRRGMLQYCTLFLLTDVVLYTKYNEFRRKYSVGAEMSVRGMEVLDCQDSEQPAVRNEPLSFTVKSKEKALNLVASTLKEKNEWIKCLKDAIAALHTERGNLPVKLPDGAGLGSRAPLWVPDNHVTACQLSFCNKKFTFSERKHHCRQCGKVVCGTCSPEKRYLTYMHKEGRVCNECVKAFAGRKPAEGDSIQQLERSLETVISGYATRFSHRKCESKWYRLAQDNVIYVYGAHEDTKPSHKIILKMGYSVHGDMGSGKITLTHPQGKEELNEIFQVSVDTYTKWYQALKERTQ